MLTDIVLAVLLGPVLGMLGLFLAIVLVAFYDTMAYRMDKREVDAKETP